MTVLVVRHAHAGDRSAWQGDDRRRPLSEKGRSQAAALVDVLAEYPVDRILSSEHDRCVQTVEPLAHRRGLEVEHHPALAEGAALDLLRRLLRQARGQHLALCSHGDVIGTLMHDLGDRGVDLGPRPRWPKGSVWVLQADPERPTVTYLPPPR
jgi:broad specificity phosphatase PhoE